MAVYSINEFSYLALRDAFMGTKNTVIAFSIPLTLTAAGLLVMGAPVAAALTPLAILAGSTAGYALNRAAHECRTAQERRLRELKISTKATRLFKREADFLTRNSGQDCPPIFLFNGSYSYGHLSLDTGLVYLNRTIVRNYSRKQVTAIIAHELGHKTEPMQSDWRGLGNALVEGGRIVRGLAVGGLIGATLTTPVLTLLPFIAGFAALPYLMNVGLHKLIRHFEYRADRYAAAVLGTPVPLAQVFRKWEKRPNPNNASKLAHLQTCLSTVSERFGEALTKPGVSFFRLAIYSGPMTQEHPTPRQRRLALLKLPRNRAQIEELKQACANSRPRSRSSQHTVS